MSIVNTAIVRVLSVALLLSFGMAGCLRESKSIRGYDCSEFEMTYL